ncbi:LysR family transcriptional regulator [Erwinia sp. 9145]|uniref:LysR family transcriptional regulator n=1 Tax=Erwinia sp. 9145 TaxID=1500895 RepID=UPI000555BAE9|nr:LysR family transcriptional regulator [Erwinia sp. 9145]
MNGFPDIDTDLLLALDALLAEQNITHAASRLGISQPAMSARLTRLRSLFGERLFVPSPHGRGVLPTPRAEALRPLVSQVLQAMTAMLAPETFDPTSSNRTFVIALHENPALMLGADLLNQMTRAAPHARLRFALPEKDRLAGELENGDIDIYIGLSASAHESWIGRRLFEDTFATAQRKQHPRGREAFDVDAFCALPHLIVSSEGDAFTGFVDRALAGSGRRRSVVMSTQSYAMAPPIVAETDLLCTLPRRMLQRFGETLDFFEPPLPLPTISVSVYWHPRNNDDPASQWLRSQIFLAAGVAD